MRIQTAENLTDAKHKLDKSLERIEMNREDGFANTVQLASQIELLDKALHWGNEMTRLGATMDDFSDCTWIGLMVGARKINPVKRLMANIMLKYRGI